MHRDFEINVVQGLLPHERLRRAPEVPVLGKKYIFETPCIISTFRY